jgi:hypothetical protein
MGRTIDSSGGASHEPSRRIIASMSSSTLTAHTGTPAVRAVLISRRMSWSASMPGEFTTTIAAAVLIAPCITTSSCSSGWRTSASHVW